MYFGFENLKTAQRRRLKLGFELEPGVLNGRLLLRCKTYCAVLFRMCVSPAVVILSWRAVVVGAATPLLRPGADGVAYDRNE